MSSEKVNVTLRSSPSASVEFPAEKGPDRSCFGALRLFPGIPRAVTRGELDWIERREPALFARLTVSPYVESKRVDRRGASEATVERLAESEGLSHLSHGRKVEVLRKRGKLKPPEKPPKPVPAKKSAEGGKATPSNR